MKIISDYLSVPTSGPVELMVWLDDGSILLVRWDSCYQTRNLLRAASDDLADPFVDCTGDETGLTEAQLSPLVDVVRSATLSEEAEYERDTEGYAEEMR